ncbi:hypothetical protein [Enterococcus mundtii]|uniref:Uncharacterized protein n=2 Tax=Enterococcus TaxID=1350 RepID=A0AAI8RB52_ENTMU|nr:hypothetical protein [Enterococcus mundtii]NBA61811.1 hypothetical protein [Enterococcus mundtii]BBM15586.1 uncharacterized protein EM151A_2405 [Enterococcus mundtii]
MYEQIKLNCIRYLDVFSFIEIGRMTIAEYKLRMKAARLKKLDEDNFIHRQAWLVAQAQGYDKKGKPIFKTFKEFFDFQKNENIILGIDEEENLKQEILKDENFVNMLIQSNTTEEGG